MSKRQIRLIIDIIISVLLVLEMFIQFTGETLHELMGFAFCICILLHISLSYAWLRAAATGMSRKELSRKNRALFVMFVLLAVVTALLGLSSVAISKLLSGTSSALTAIIAYDVWYVMHVICSYSLCVLVLGHLAMHWFAVIKHLRVPYNPERRKAIATCANAVAVVGSVALISTCAKVVGASVGGENDASTESSGQDEGSAQEQEDYFSSEQDDEDWFSDEGYPSRPGNRPSFGGQSGYSNSESDSYSDSDSGSSSGSSNSGICTLCNKRCSLSNPRCDRPYQEGLID